MRILLLGADFDSLNQKASEIETTWRENGLTTLRLSGADVRTISTSRGVYELLASRCFFIPELIERSLVVVDDVEPDAAAGPLWQDLLAARVVDLGPQCRLLAEKVSIVATAAAREASPMGFGLGLPISKSEESQPAADSKKWPGWEEVYRIPAAAATQAQREPVAENL